MVLTFQYLKNYNFLFGKINTRISLPPNQVCEVWDYRKSNVKSIQKAIQNFDWVKAFEHLSVDGRVDVLNETIMNIFRNYIPSKKVKCNYCQPPWMNDKIKKCLRERSKLTKIYYKQGKKNENQERKITSNSCILHRGDIKS